MSRFLAIFLLLLLYFDGLAQVDLAAFASAEKKKFAKIRSHAKKAKPQHEISVSTLADYLQQVAVTDLEKSYAAFYWTSYHITYDMQSFQAGRYPSYQPDDVLRSKLAVCNGYAHLLQALYTSLGIKSHVVSGYSKGYGYIIGTPFDVSNHSWNSVLIRGKWYLIDATWAASKNNAGIRSGPISDKYFLSHPKAFLSDHLPEDPKWQLVSPQITLSDFEKSPDLGEKVNYALVINDDIDHIDDYMDIGKREVALQKRILDFNPKNTTAVYKLGVALLYQAEDIMEQMHELSYQDVLATTPEYKYRVYALIDQSAVYFKKVPKGPMYESAQTFLSETVYQKGVFNYEAAQIIYDTTIPLTAEEYHPLKVGFSEARIAYYDIASDYFGQISSSSWHYEEAQDYLRVIAQERQDVIDHLRAK